jgi:hypothetical protein
MDALARLPRACGGTDPIDLGFDANDEPVTANCALANKNDGFVD